MGLDLIQSCITRMANCSFSLKGWYISLVTLALTLLIGQGCKVSIIGLVLFGVTTIFWGLDGFFLKMETLYRWKYEWVINVKRHGKKRKSILNTNAEELMRPKNVRTKRGVVWTKPNSVSQNKKELLLNVRRRLLIGKLWQLGRNRDLGSVVSFRLKKIVF